MRPQAAHMLPRRALVVCVALLAHSCAALRFAVGDRVECHMGEQQWEAGTVSQLHVEDDGETAAYLVTLDGGKGQVVAPFDDNRFIKAEGATDTAVSARLLRFAVGTRVEANLGMYWARGTVTKLNYHEESFGPGVTMPYAIKIDNGDTVYAPQDDDEYIRREGQIQMRDPRLRFGVGDRVEVLMSSREGEGQRWEEGLVVALNYHEPRFGDGVTMPYQIKLERGGANGDDNSALIFTPKDDDAMIRRVQPAGASAASTSKFSRSRVGRRANTIGIARHESKVGGSKLGGAQQGARARTHASARPAEKRPGEALAEWLAATDVSM